MVQSGVTLVELLVVLVLLGLMSGVSLLALPALRPPPDGEQIAQAQHARALAIRRGQEVVITIDSMSVRFLPDGWVLGGPFDPLTGAWRHAP
ncbi:MAG: prepilin-type N-terminal cleavage/methylation domain-containing protein [Gemmatimonadota bacterium]